MPDQISGTGKNTVVSSFIGLQSYTEKQADHFFGRDEEINLLTILIQTNALTTVFGKSGTGKTSLLNAGVFPKLRKDNSLPFNIRLDFRENSPDLITQIKNVLRSEIDRYGFTVEHYPGTETLWEYFHTEPLWSSVTPILVFDQFEEIFTLAKKSSHFGDNEIAMFWEELSDLVENSIPGKLIDEFLNHKENIHYDYKTQKIKMLFAFREEYLPEFESIKTKIPSIKYSRFRLMPMNGNQAYDVITKTWKNNIDESVANKIVGFFINDDNKKRSYDLMEIEPSLLSQVCLFIDRKRIDAGGNNISAKLLDDYPREKILRSIYDEVLDESNKAVNNKSNELIIHPKPINEFVENKLITDEGFRTKYVLLNKDENLKPGVEILITKYFLRDDGKSVELTHDVLTPLIKTDREKRRKGIALAIAKEKAKRRALRIIILSILGAFLVWFAGTYRAFKDRDKAQTQKDSLDAQIWLLKKDSIRLALANKDSSGTGKKGGDDPNSNGTSGLITKINNSDSLQIIKDSIQNLYTGLQIEFNKLITGRSSLKNDITDLNSMVDKLTQTQIKTDSINNLLQRYIVDLRKQKLDDSANFVKKYYLLKGDYDLLKRNFDEYKLRYPVTPPDVPVNITPGIHSIRPPEAPDTNSLQLNLYYSSPKNMTIPANLKIYVIPNSSYNKKIIKRSMLYEIRCDELGLDSAQDSKIAKFSNKKYSFPDVPPGNYFIKICAYYGGYYYVTKKGPGNEKTMPLDLSPPIR